MNHLSSFKGRGFGGIIQKRAVSNYLRKGEGTRLVSKSMQKVGSSRGTMAGTHADEHTCKGLTCEKGLRKMALSPTRMPSAILKRCRTSESSASLTVAPVTTRDVS